VAFAGPQQVLKYLSNYTHRVAISNRRLLGADERSVTFGYKDYADGSRRKTMTLEVEEFVRRFCLHVLPERFVKIRHYGLLANRQRRERVEQARALLGVSGPAPILEMELQKPPEPESQKVPCCPFCGRRTLVFLREVPPMHRARSVPALDTS
jgi:hypothetical protein